MSIGQTYKNVLTRREHKALVAGCDLLIDLVFDDLATILYEGQERVADTLLAAHLPSRFLPNYWPLGNNRTEKHDKEGVDFLYRIRCSPEAIENELAPHSVGGSIGPSWLVKPIESFVLPLSPAGLVSHRSTERGQSQRDIGYASGRRSVSLVLLAIILTCS